MDNQSELIQVLQQGLAQVVTAINGTNERIDSTNQKLDGAIQRLDGIDNRLDGIDNRLGGIDNRLDNLTTELRQFKVEVRDKFDGLGLYLQKLDAPINNNAERIYKLERRVDDIEKKFGT